MGCNQYKMSLIGFVALCVVILLGCLVLYYNIGAGLGVALGGIIIVSIVEVGIQEKYSDSDGGKKDNKSED